MSEEVQEQPQQATGVAVQSVLKKHEDYVMTELAAVSEKPVDVLLNTALQMQKPSCALPEEYKKSIKTIDELRKAMKAHKVATRKRGQELLEPISDHMKWVKAKADEIEGKYLQGERHYEKIQNELQTELQQQIDATNKAIAKSFEDYGFEWDQKAGCLRYAGSKLISVDGLHAVKQEQMDLMCDEHDAWLDQQEKLRQQLAEKAKSIRNMFFKLFAQEFCAGLAVEADRERAAQQYQAVVDELSDEVIVDDPSIQEKAFNLFLRDWQPTKTEDVREYPLTPEDAIAPHPAEPEPSHEKINVELDASAGFQAPNYITEPLPLVEQPSDEDIFEVEYEEGGIQGAPPTQEDVEAAEKYLELHEEFRKIALQSRIKEGRLGGTLVFEDMQLTEYGMKNGLWSEDNLKAYGGILVCESIFSQDVLDQIIVRWNAMAPARSGRTSRGAGKGGPKNA